MEEKGGGAGRRQEKPRTDGKVRGRGGWWSLPSPRRECEFVALLFLLDASVEQPFTEALAEGFHEAVMVRELPIGSIVVPFWDYLIRF